MDGKNHHFFPLEIYPGFAKRKMLPRVSYMVLWRPQKRIFIDDASDNEAIGGRSL
jgi:hypothetical protein